MTQNQSNYLNPHGPAASAAGEKEEGGINLGELVAILLEFKWLVLALTLVALLVGVVLIQVSTPIYRADGLLQIEAKTNKKGIAALEGVQSVMPDISSIVAELEILRSRMILGRVVDRLNLTVRAEPRYAPMLGRALARGHSAQELADPILGLGQFAWGGERIVVGSLEFGKERSGGELTLVAGQSGAYKVTNAAGDVLVTGQVGELSKGGSMTMFVNELKARPGTEFVLYASTREAAINALNGQLEVKERARGSGVVELALRDSDPVRASTVLGEILNAYVGQNVEYRSAEAEKTLAFLDSQLPKLKAQMDSAEAAYNRYRQGRGSVDLEHETKTVLDSVVSLEDELLKLQNRRDELRQLFTPEHPQVQAIDSQISRLRGRRSSLDGDVSKLPDTQQTALRLKRDVEVATVLYTDLLNNAQQLRVARAGTVGDVRVIDNAITAAGPVAPRKALIMLVSGVLGLVVGLLTVWIARSLRVTVDDPDRIEKELGLPVFATVPRSKVELNLAKSASTGDGGGKLLAVVDPDDEAVESLRGLRTTLHFALLDSNHRSILITGPTPGVGKSFLSRNLGAVLAHSGKRVVVVDADLRKGHIHKEFGMAREGGVSEFVAGSIAVVDVLRTTVLSGLSIVTTGHIPPNPSELLMHPRFALLLHALEESFDVVIVDAPPVLAVSDAAIIGRHVGATLMVVRSETHPMREMEQAVKRLAQSGVHVKGVVFNDMDMSRQRYRYGYQGYVYSYKYK
ncbi:MAG: polysaccharide biosynthesis tyrosine autokinase [Zoogloea sp.]|uniref:polysaccharide biosynthesis tyrosine autokinase n=1 Tax=Zoogloea sp. TaxID=49181 RepID=UPI00261F1403|nr:polysaccharide biosynthesis tyrosine autokinase [Zoogloea sp.]MDD2989164.1 polysaccharide biosynthesis tyrosine autokinase [Zoogloea sp.]